MSQQVTLVTGSDLVVVFDACDDRIAAQCHVMIGANLDVETHTIPADQWDQVRARLARDHADVDIIDARREAPRPQPTTPPAR